MRIHPEVDWIPCRDTIYIQSVGKLVSFICMLRDVLLTSFFIQEHVDNVLSDIFIIITYSSVHEFNNFMNLQFV